MEQNNSNSKASFVFLLNKGNQVAFEALYRLYYDKLIHLAKNYLVYKEDAEEIVQDVFLKLWEQKGKLEENTNINAYIYAVTKNACLDRIRHEKVKRNFSQQRYNDLAAIQSGFIKDETASLILEQELEERITKSLDLLPEKCRNIFIKSRMDGLKHKEIAKELGISKKTVENHIAKALKHMKLHLKDFLVTFF